MAYGGARAGAGRKPNHKEIFEAADAKVAEAMKGIVLPEGVTTDMSAYEVLRLVMVHQLTNKNYLHAAQIASQLMPYEMPRLSATVIKADITTHKDLEDASLETLLSIAHNPPKEIAGPDQSRGHSAGQRKIKHLQSEASPPDED